MRSPLSHMRYHSVLATCSISHTPRASRHSRLSPAFQRQAIVQTAAPFATSTMSAMQLHQPTLHALLLPEQVSMTRSLSSSQVPPNSASRSFSALMSLESADAELPQKIKPLSSPATLLPSTFSSLSAASSVQSAESETKPPQAAAATALLSHAFDFDSEDRLQKRPGVDEVEEGVDCVEHMSGSLTRSQPSPFELALRTAADDSVCASSMKGADGCANAAAASLSASTSAALSHFGVNFSWTRGEMIGRGGFGVVYANFPLRGSVHCTDFGCGRYWAFDNTNGNIIAAKAIDLPGE